VHGGKDVFIRVGGWRGGMSVEETVVGVGGGDGRGVSDLTSYRDFAG
jgi:hypothetical protein